MFPGDMYYYEGGNIPISYVISNKYFIGMSLNNINPMKDEKNMLYCWRPFTLNGYKKM